MYSHNKSISICIILLLASSVGYCEAIVADHNAAADFDKMPDYWIGKAKQMFRLSYGHTSHGSQIISGINIINDQNTGSDSDAVSCNGYNCGDCLHDYCDDRYYYLYGAGNDQAPAGTLSIFDDYPSGDLGHNGSLVWEDRTRTMLEDSRYDSRNMVIWSWCGGCSDNTKAGINIYLNAMNQLEIDYPDIVFVYMTGHLDSSGETGNLNIRNNQIRNYCTTNDKILFDFADIESYDPDGNYYLDKAANDNCDYWVNSVKHNWADEWCTANPGMCPGCNSCAHSKCLNCYLKGKAFWWMMARIAGWDGCTAVDGDISGDCKVDMVDYCIIADHWLDTGCDSSNDWCCWSDFQREAAGVVEPNDLKVVTDNWLK